MVRCSWYDNARLVQFLEELFLTNSNQKVAARKSPSRKTLTTAPSIKSMPKKSSPMNYTNPIDTDRKLNVLCTFNLRPVSMEKAKVTENSNTFFY